VEAESFRDHARPKFVSRVIAELTRPDVEQEAPWPLLVISLPVSSRSSNVYNSSPAFGNPRGVPCWSTLERGKA